MFKNTIYNCSCYLIEFHNARLLIQINYKYTPNNQKEQ